MFGRRPKAAREFAMSMSKRHQVTGDRSISKRYQETIIASGLVDDVGEIEDLDPKPHRFLEGDFICSRGDRAESLWIIVSGSVSVRDESRTLFVRGPNEVVGEQNLLGNGFLRMYDLVASESQVEILEIDKPNLEKHPRSKMLWKNISKIISLKLKEASVKSSSLSRRLEDDTRILKAYMNEYALSRRLKAGGGRLTDYKVERAIVWFSDVVNFSRHVLELAPTRTADIVQRFFNAQSLPITECGGHIDKFMGDGMMAFWIMSESERVGLRCSRAIKAAEQAVKAVGKIKIGMEPLCLRVGLHIGLVLSGDFGSVARHQFTLIGPEVNKAARLEQVHANEVVEGETDVGAVRISSDFRKELADPVKQKYRRYSKARAKNIGQIDLFS
jgi:class 3 adenylate cyclase